MTCVKINGGILCVQPTFNPGDLPPKGYLAWHEWAEVQRKAGIKQVECGVCGRWKTPQELSAEINEYTVRDKYGRPVVLRSPVCTNCANLGGKAE